MPLRQPATVGVRVHPVWLFRAFFWLLNGVSNVGFGGLPTKQSVGEFEESFLISLYKGFIIPLNPFIKDL